MTDRHVFADGEAIRVVGHNLLVRVLERPEMTAGGIVVPKTALPDAVGLGEVLAVGYQSAKRAPPHTPIPGIQAGDFVAFAIFHEKVDSNPQIQRLTGERIIRLRSADILLVMDADDVKRLH